jgi:hypothetical protein
MGKQDCYCLLLRNINGSLLGGSLLIAVVRCTQGICVNDNKLEEHKQQVKLKKAPGLRSSSSPVEVVVDALGADATHMYTGSPKLFFFSDASKSP